MMYNYVPPQLLCTTFSGTWRAQCNAYRYGVVCYQLTNICAMTFAVVVLCHFIPTLLLPSCSRAMDQALELVAAFRELAII